MKLDVETRSKIADIIYELNVEPDAVDAVVDQIEAALPAQKIEIDLAGAMEKITPDMMDQTRDLMIEALTRRGTEMHDALKPFADKVFNDNGDITVQDSHRLTTEDFARAYYAFRGEAVTAEKIAEVCANADTPFNSAGPADWQSHPEDCIVHYSATGGAVCVCPDPKTAAWIADRLRLADKMVRRQDKPQECRERLRAEGKAYPRSGCTVCRTSIANGFKGCPYE